MIFDTHCHAYWNGLASRKQDVLRNMLAEGVTRSVQIGTGLEKSRRALDLAREWGDNTWCAGGIHPTDCQDRPQNSAPEAIMQIEELVRSNRDKMVAIGETGFDYFHVSRGKEKEQKQTQRVFFAAQAELSLRLDLPLIIHTRDAAEDTIAILKQCGIQRAVIHCYSESPGFAEKLLDWSDGIYFSFSGILTYTRSVAVQETARTLPLNRILVETDAPFLVPQAVRDRFSTNEPAFTRHVMDFLKTLRPEPADEVEQTVWDNSNKFFGI
jgi:TatD DNase family protein